MNGKTWSVNSLVADQQGTRQERIEVQLGIASTKQDVIESINRLSGYWNSRIEILEIKEVIA